MLGEWPRAMFDIYMVERNEPCFTDLKFFDFITVFKCL